METKLVIGDSKTGKAYSKSLSAQEAEIFISKKIGEEVDLSSVGLNGYTAEITGGSYMTGTPMRNGIDGIGLKKILTESGVGNKQRIRRRKSVGGSTVSQFTSQINVKISKYGDTPVDQVLAAKKENG